MYAVLKNYTCAVKYVEVAGMVQFSTGQRQRGGELAPPWSRLLRLSLRVSKGREDFEFNEYPAWKQNVLLLRSHALGVIGVDHLLAIEHFG